MHGTVHVFAAEVALAAAVGAHLTHIFEKTGVRRQVELVRLLVQGERELTKTDRTGRI